ncbi:KRI1-like family C-terminal-domain-containing protein [Gloeopeniophorella convolvens]|nr:KRI1-like family C-terminal-domain-containing protein [Gloeopeniophorella convolvens]
MKETLISSSSSSSESEDENGSLQLTINEHYAKAFQYRKEREELATLKEKYGSDADTDELSGETDSESDTTEDEDGEELTPAVDAAILRTLARIKARDPEIYESSRNVFDEERGKSGSAPAPKPAKQAKSKPLTLPAHRLAAALDDATSSRSTSPEPAPPTHTAEQAALRAETIAAFHSGAADEEEEEEGGLFTLREKTRDEAALEEAEYRAYLEREVGPLEEILDLGEGGAEAGASAGAREEEEEKEKGKKAEERKETDQEFLINYILNRGWIDRSARRVPTYNEVTAHASSSKSRATQPDTTVPGADSDAGADADADGSLGDENEFDEIVERFESSYNFRFEEPDAAHIPAFPRAVESVRRPSEHAERRREARERRRERKEAEKTQRREEVKRLKGLKTREMRAKLERIGKEGGWADSQALEALDVDGDWDADAYDRQMAAVLAETEGGADDDDDEKPAWDDDVDIGDIVPPSGGNGDGEGRRAADAKERKKAKKKEKKKKKRGGEDGGAGGIDTDDMDADADAAHEGGAAWDEMEWDGTEEMRKRVLDQYMEELYGLEFNDMVAGMPTRFRYVPVEGASFALTPAEILLADDKDLNEYVGLKKLAPYRKQREAWDARRGERLREFKQKVAPRVGEFGADEHARDAERKTKKRKGKKERLREKVARGEEDEEPEEPEEPSPSPSSKGTKRRAEAADREDAPAAEGVEEPAKKKRRRQKRSGKAE